MLKPSGEISIDDFGLTPITSQTHTQKVEPNKQQIEDAMRLHKGVIAKVAREFGLSRQALYRRLDKFEIAY